MYHITSKMSGAKNLTGMTEGLSRRSSLDLAVEERAAMATKVTTIERIRRAPNATRPAVKTNGAMASHVIRTWARREFVRRSWRTFEGKRYARSPLSVTSIGALVIAAKLAA